MPLPQEESRQITLEEYEALPPDIRAEVYDGQIRYMASPSQNHQTLLLELSGVLNAYVKKNAGGCRVFPAPFDVKLNDNPLIIVQPDIMIVCDKDKLDGKRCNGAPDFIIEIVSPGNQSDDYIRKLYYYKNYGVREYWIVDPAKERTTVYRYEEDAAPMFYLFADDVPVGIFPELAINVADLLK